VLAFPTNLRALADIWKARGEVPAGLRHLRAVGETVSEELRAHVEATDGLGIEDNYSSQEAGVIALQCPASGLYHVMAESLVVEVLDDDGAACAEGEVGRVVITDLHNFASPLIRYDIGDYAEVGGRCTCGRALPTLKRIRGRERNLLIKPDGTRHWPLVGFHRFAEVAPVQQYQVVQLSLEEIELKVVTRGAAVRGGRRRARRDRPRGARLPRPGARRAVAHPAAAQPERQVRGVRLPCPRRAPRRGPSRERHPRAFAPVSTASSGRRCRSATRRRSPLWSRA
jgi:phenylacetate-CoA ligase